MNVCNMRELKPLLERHGFSFSKSLGQNFLTDASVPERIAGLGGFDRSCGVLEVGPGAGALTLELSARAGKVVACELDRRLIPVLEETLAGTENVSVVNADIMKLDIKALADEALKDFTPCACANLPYYITTPVLQRLIESERFARIVVMVQREVAQRITARPGTSDYGALSVFAGFYTDARILFTVPPSCFIPAPKVHSAIVRMDMLKERAVSKNGEAMFFRVVRASFGQRRKTLVNGLSAVFREISKEQLAEIVTGCGLDARVRGETLEIKKFAQISREISAAIAGKQTK